MSIDASISQLRQRREKHFDLAKFVLRADNGAIYPTDLLVMSTLNRSICLLSGFISLIESRNFVAASPLVRLQLDNCIRLSAATIVDDPHQLSINIMKGVPVRKQRDKSKQLMSDQYLVENLTKKNPWIRDVYNNTSGYIHLSEKHFFNAIRVSGENEQINLKISDVDTFVPDEIYIEAIEAFKASTDMLFEYISSWAYVKTNSANATDIS